MCEHASTSLVSMSTKDNGDFLSVQCDICGAVLPNIAIDNDTFDAWNSGDLKVPRMDFRAYCRAVDITLRDVLGDGTGELATLARVVNDGGKR